MALLSLSCSPEYYKYDGTRYKLFRNVPEKGVQIRALDISNITEKIPPEIFQQTELIYLNLSSKDLETISFQICGLTSLKVLLLNNNSGLTDLPECISELKNLEVLSIVGCEIDSLPTKLGAMQHLKTLAIAGNRFTGDELEELKSLLPETKVIAYID